MLVENPGFAGGLGLQIHIRTKIETWWSYIESAVIQIGDQVFELKGGPDGEGPHYWVNGLPGNEAVESDENLKALEKEMTVHLEGFKIHYKKVSSKQHKFRIDLNNQGDAISMQTYKDWVAVNVKANKAENFVGAKGLMGAFPSGSMVGRNDVIIADDTDAFGKEWQVLESEPKLFHSIEGVQHPMECAMPEKLDVSTKQRRLGESMITEEDAATACARVGEEDRDACIFDVLATNDKDFAGSY